MGSFQKRHVLYKIHLILLSLSNQPPFRAATPSGLTVLVWLRHHKKTPGCILCAADTRAAKHTCWRWHHHHYENECDQFYHWSPTIHLKSVETNLRILGSDASMLTKTKILANLLEIKEILILSPRVQAVWLVQHQPSLGLVWKKTLILIFSFNFLQL